MKKVDLRFDFNFEFGEPSSALVMGETPMLITDLYFRPLHHLLFDVCIWLCPQKQISDY